MQMTSTLKRFDGSTETERAVNFFFDFLVVFISTCLVTVTPQCILFSEMVKKDSKVKLQIGDTL